MPAEKKDTEPEGFFDPERLRLRFFIKNIAKRPRMFIPREIADEMVVIEPGTENAPSLMYVPGSRYYFIDRVPYSPRGVPPYAVPYYDKEDGHWHFRWTDDSNTKHDVIIDSDSNLDYPLFGIFRRPRGVPLYARLRPSIDASGNRRMMFIWTENGNTKRVIAPPVFGGGARKPMNKRGKAHHKRKRTPILPISRLLGDEPHDGSGEMN